MKTSLLATLVFVLAISPAALTQDTGSRAGSPTPSAPASNGSAESAEYRLVVGDKLRIEVYRDPQLSQSLEIRPDGKITIPLIGDVQAAGATSQELTATLTDRLREYITSPVVTVIVAEATPPMIYVMGEVNSPGAQPARGTVTVLQALAIAGGFREFANTRRIRVLRKGADGTIQTIPFNYRDAVDRADRPMLLQPGDTVIVP